MFNNVNYLIKLATDNTDDVMRDEKGKRLNLIWQTFLKDEGIFEIGFFLVLQHLF